MNFLIQNEAATSTRSARRRSRTRSKSISNELVEEDNTDYYAHERKRSRRRSRSRSRSLNPDGTPFLYNLLLKKSSLEIFLYLFQINPKPKVLAMRVQ